jgi:hypothetical protein
VGRAYSVRGKNHGCTVVSRRAINDGLESLDLNVVSAAVFNHHIIARKMGMKRSMWHGIYIMLGVAIL